MRIFILFLWAFWAHAQTYQIYLPHFTSKAGQWQTTLSLVNPTLITQAVSVQAFDMQGQSQEPITIFIPPNGAMTGWVADLLPNLAFERGWLSIRSDSAHILGTVQFTETQAHGSTTLPLSAAPAQDLLLARLQTSEDWQSGLSIVNPGGDVAHISAVLRNQSGAIVSSQLFELAGYAKRVDMLQALTNAEELPAETSLQLHSDRPILAFGLSFATGNTQIVAVPAHPFEPGTEASSLNTLLKVNLAQELKKNPTFPSLYLGVAQTQGNYQFYAADGLQNPQTAVAAMPEDGLRLASVTKTFTAALILRLQEEGLLNIEQNVADFLSPETLTGLHEFQGVDYGNQITIHQLLNHTSGLGDHFFDGDENHNGTPDLIEILLSEPNTFWTPQMVLDYARNFTQSVGVPGSGFHYTDLGYVLLGLIIEQITHTSLTEAYHDWILDPLEMDHTWMEFRETPRSVLAHTFIGELDISEFTSVSSDWAGGGLVSTASDLCRFLKALLSGTFFKSDATLAQMLNSVESDSLGYYGLGIEILPTEYGTFIGHTGFSGAFMFYWVERDAVLAGSTNQTEANIEQVVIQLAKPLAGFWRETQTPVLEQDTVLAHNIPFGTISRSGEGVTVVFESGSGSSKEAWSPVLRQVADWAPVFAYDRAGLGDTPFFGQERTASVVVEELRALLAQAQVKPPYLLVGHSMGGLFMNYFARTYPQEVAGLVLVDASHPLQIEAQCAAQPEFCLPDGWWADLPEPVRSEIRDFERSGQQVLAAGAFPVIPLSVITAGQDLQPFWATLQEDLANMTDSARHVTDPKSGHFVQADNPSVVSAEIYRVLQKAQAIQ
ncbi:MAG: class A beta-lactamase-related serine hydrolase [Acidobacteria bacterium]|nr:class A beta-lactamase-related serine hydrolase [Acidobacteriota bacterium]